MDKFTRDLFKYVIDVEPSSRPKSFHREPQKDDTGRMGCLMIVP